MSDKDLTGYSFLSIVVGPFSKTPETTSYEEVTIYERPPSIVHYVFV